jgi:hypothetical protein
MNKNLKQMFRAFINKAQNNWLQLLPFFEFALNNSINSTTKHTPFYLVHGQHPHLPEILNISPLPPLSGNASVADLLNDLYNTIEIVKQNIATAQQYQSKYYNKSHRHHIFKLNEYVLLDAENISVDKIGNAKLNDKYIGPFKIIKVNSNHSYTLELPLHYRIHNTFHISKLKPYHSSSYFQREQNTRPEPIINSSNEKMYEVESILDYRLVKIKKKPTGQMLIKWKNFPSSENTWEPISSLKIQVPELVKQFLASYKSKQ